MDKCTEWRLQGMYYAYDIAKRDGIEALENELRFRKNSGLKQLITPKEMKELHQAVISRTSRAILLLSVMVLIDELDADNDDLQRFIKRFNEKAAGIAENYTTWEEQMLALKEERGIEVAFE